MFETAKIWVKVLREQEKVDYLIGLFHSGDNTLYDRDVASTRKLPHSNAAGMIADFFLHSTLFFPDTPTGSVLNAGLKNSKDIRLRLCLPELKRKD